MKSDNRYIIIHSILFDVAITFLLSSSVAAGANRVKCIETIFSFFGVCGYFTCLRMSDDRPIAK